MWDEPVSYHEARSEYMLDMRMTEYKQDAMTKLSTILKDGYLEEIAGIIAYAYTNDDEDANRIASRLNLQQLHFDAVLGDEENFKLNYANKF